jgi:hypothetical protein
MQKSGIMEDQIVDVLKDSPPDPSEGSAHEASRASARA